jgi:twinkle protein
MNVPQDNYNDKELLEFIGQQESQDIGTTTDFAQQIDERLENGRVLRGATLPWNKTHDHIRFAPGQVTIWAGMNGHKKSMLLGQVLMWMAQEERVGVSSFEMPVVDTMERMVSQAAGCSPSREFAQKWVNWGEGKMWFYDQLDTVPAERVLGSMYYMAKGLGCKHIMIDSLTKCGLPAGDRDAEKRFIDTIAAAAKALDVHIHLVSHVRKPPQGGEAYIPNKFDIRGAGELTDLVDNVMIVWMDKKKEALSKKLAAGINLDGTDTEYMDKNPDQRLICCKQRHGAWEGTIGLWFDSDSLQFTADSGGRTLPFDVYI